MYLFESENVFDCGHLFAVIIIWNDIISEMPNWSYKLQPDITRPITESLTKWLIVFTLRLIQNSPIPFDPLLCILVFLIVSHLLKKKERVYTYKYKYKKRYTLASVLSIHLVYIVCVSLFLIEEKKSCKCGSSWGGGAQQPPNGLFL